MRMRSTTAALLTLFSACAVLAAPARAELRLPTLFTDHAVLQRDKELSVWGWADARAAVEIRLNESRVSTTADANGRWQATLPAMKSGGPFEFVVASGKDTRTIRDVYVGDVWLCTGQSNMAHTMAEAENGATDAAASDYPKLRTFRVRESIADEPRDDAPGASWVVCSPQTAMGFSAVAYYFGRKVQKEADVPIGLLVCAWGGSSAAAWMSREALDRPELRRQVPFDVFGWREPTRPNKLYCGMLHGVAPFAVRGVLWYQGETDAEAPYNAYLYRDLLAGMIADWRTLWREPELPFYIVQLPILKSRDWTVLRESQDAVARRVPHVGMITTIDISRPGNLHPPNKHESAGRLADLVLFEQYGQQHPAYGPRYKQFNIDGPGVRVELERAGGLKTTDGQPPRGFAIAGEDRKFIDAEAKLEGEAIVVSAAPVTKPVAVRYAWSAEPKVNVVNDAGLPLSPFRTDRWPVAGQAEMWAKLPAKADLARQVSGAQLTSTGSAWRRDGSKLSSELIASRKLLRPAGKDAVQVAVPDRAIEPGATRSPRLFWHGPAEAFAPVDPAKGCTVQLDALAFSATLPLSGLELLVRVPYPDGRLKQYRIAIAPARVFALHGSEVRVIGYDLDTAGSHAYRIAVRPEGAAQIYFDSRELGTLPGEWVESPGTNSATPGISIGKPYDGGTLTATIERVSYDGGGAFQP
jgi:sialate O-acetylesterase